VCEVEIDPETGAAALRRYCSVDDCGQPINPLILHGQVHGGVVQGAGQALSECVTHDPSSGQVLTGSFMDYAMPRADQAPPLVLDHIENLSTRNPLGVKGLGEGGAIAPPAAIANAVEDALKPLGVIVHRAPLSPARVRGLIARAIP
jgi:carbon-monoxide dehydrogenase large subunit